MKILFIASECAPFVKAGGLGDVVGALPKALRALGHDVRVLLPRYGSISTKNLKSFPHPIGIPMGRGTAWCQLYFSTIPDSEVPVYFLEHESVYGGSLPYGGEERTLWGCVKFGLLCRSVFEISRFLNFKPDILHVHDWPTAWLPVMMNSLKGDEKSKWQQVASVLTIHNMSHQPRFPYEGLEHIGLDAQFFRSDGLEDFGEVNPFKGGLYHSTMITTVSPQYAAEIRDQPAACGLEDVIRFRAADLVGILNGIDSDVWDPSNDPYICQTYSAGDLSGKVKCKAALQKEVGLTVDPNVPVIGMISRLTSQKGIDLLIEAADGIMAMGAQIVCLGSGDEGLQDALRIMEHRRPGQFAAWIGYNEGLAHRIEAGSDLYLMPSRFEPCGLNQLYSQRYGTLPIVHATGGLVDTVQQYDASSGEGTGFRMNDLKLSSVVNVVGWALQVYRNEPEAFLKMQLRCMNKNMGWDIAAKRYQEVYWWALERKGAGIRAYRR